MYDAGSAALSSSSSPAADELGGTAATVGDDADVVVVAALAADDGFFSLSWGLRERLWGVSAAQTRRGRPRVELWGSDLARGLACEARAFRSNISLVFCGRIGSSSETGFDPEHCRTSSTSEEQRTLLESLFYSWTHFSLRDALTRSFSGPAFPIPKEIHLGLMSQVRRRETERSKERSKERR